MISALVYSHTITPRVQYLVDFLTDYYGLSFKVTSSEEIYLKDPGQCKINYSDHRIAKNEIHILPHVILFESSTRSVRTDCFIKGNYIAFFKTEDDFGFDLFAAVFFLVTRYEEYLTYKKDSYGRYAHENSLAFREDFLHLPLVNIWLEDFRQLLAVLNIDFTQNKRRFSFIPTYDIDIAWSYKNKGALKNTGALLQSFLTGNWRKTQQRINVLNNKAQDPYDTYEWMDTLHQEYNLDPLYFFLVAMKKGKYDKNIDVVNKEFRKLIHKTAIEYKVGLHPSWASGSLPNLLFKEKELMEHVTGHPVKISRQHYIRMQMPATYQNLIALGFEADYSMGYGDINGFRASVTTSYYWYNLKKEETTKLLIHPFCFMDANSYYEQNDSPIQALEELNRFKNIISTVKGEMITIWHNNILGTDRAFRGWRQTYQQFIAAL